MRAMKFKRNVAFGSDVLFKRGEVLTESDVGVRVRKELVGRGLVLFEAPKLSTKVVKKPTAPPEDKSVKPKSTKRSTKSKGRTWHSGH